MWFEEQTELITRNSVLRYAGHCGAPDRFTELRNPRDVLPSDHLADLRPGESIWWCVHCGQVWFQSTEKVVVRERRRNRKRIQVRRRIVGLYKRADGRASRFSFARKVGPCRLAGRRRAGAQATRNCISEVRCGCIR